MAHIRFNKKESKQSSVQDGQYIHGDFGRQNVLFQAGTADAAAVIDYENIRFGSRSEEIARTVSLLLVDTKLRNSEGSMYTPQEYSQELIIQFKERMSAVLDTYPDSTVNRDEILVYTKAFLDFEDYGGLNQIRDFAVSFLTNL